MKMRAGLIVTGSNVLASLLGFARNIILARLIGVEDFGIAATFLITASVLEMLTNLSADRMIVQDREGDTERLLDAMHGLALVRSVFNAAALFLLAWPLSAFFGNSDLLWAYQMVALVPLIRALRHNGSVAMQRQMRFGSTAVLSISAPLIALIAVWPMAMWLGDYRVMLVQILLMAATTTVVSHLVARRRYRVGWDLSVVRRAFSFGWPLLINGGLTFAVMQGDRMVIANQIGPYELGLFSAALTLAMTPTLIAARSLRVFFMPLLSRLQDDREGFAGAMVATMQVVLCAGAGVAVGAAILGPWLFPLVYGDAFAPGTEAFLWLSLMFAMRLVREGPTTVAMSMAHTRNPMYANMVRMISLPLAFWAAASGYSMITVVAISTAGELCSLALSIALLRMRMGEARLDRLALPYGLALTLAVICAWLAADAGAPGFDWRQAAAVALLVGLIAASGDMRRRIGAELRRRPKA